MTRQYFAPLVIMLAVCALYGSFVYNPIVFDDQYFFLPGVPEQYLALDGLYPRHLAHMTLALSWKWFGSSLLAFRLEGIALHAAVAIVLYYFLCEIQTCLVPDIGRRLSLLPCLLALIFALHPVSVYAAAYLIQRTIVMATLFALLSWTCFLRGLRSGQERWIWCSVAAYALAGLSKETVVMAPAVSVTLALWWWRSQTNRCSLGQLIWGLRWFLVVSGIIAVLLSLSQWGVIGRSYEFGVERVTSVELPAHAWMLSVITQGMLFFKYLVLWILPNPLWMSVDMRETFATSITAWPQLVGFAAFLLWLMVGCVLLWQGKRRGLVGFAMLAPTALFATELVAVRYLEVFVLYRSYLWAAPGFAGALVIDQWIRDKAIISMIVIIPLCLSVLAWNRLMTFSNPLLLWDDAASLIDGKDGVVLAERIYRNRGISLAKFGKLEMAIQDYSKAIQNRPDYSYAYNDRGAALLRMGRNADALLDFDRAISLDADYPNSQAGRGAALEAMKRMSEAKDAYMTACQLGWKAACLKVASLK